MKKFIIILIALGLPTYLFGQSDYAIGSHRVVTVVLGDSLIEASVLQKKHDNIVIIPDLVYFWYEDYNIHSNQGGYSGLLLDGYYCVYTVHEHAMIWQGSFNNGLKEGEWKRWDKNGMLIEMASWKGGRLDGARILYNEGDIMVSEMYKNGLLDGKVTLRQTDGSMVERHYTDGKEKVAKNRRSASDNKEKHHRFLRIKRQKRVKDNDKEGENIFSEERQN